MFRRAIIIFSFLLLTTACSLEARIPEPPSTIEALQAPTETQPTAEPAPTVDAEAATFTVQRGTVAAELVLNGRVRFVEVGASFVKSGSIATILVEPGEEVTQGQLLAQLSGADMEDQLLQARADYNQANSAIQQAIAAAQVDVQRAQLGVEAARLQLEDAKRPARPHEITNARALLQQAESRLSTVRNTVSATKNNALEEMNTAVVFLEVAQHRYSDAVLVFETISARTEVGPDLEEARDELREARENLRNAEDRLARARIAYDTALGNEVAAVQNAEAEVMDAQAQLERLLAGPDPIAIAEAERNVRLAEVGVQEASLRLRPDPMLSRAASLAQNQIRNLERELESRQLFAPIAGTVTRIDLTRGGTVLADAPVLIIADATKQEIVTDFTTHRTTLPIGQQVALSFARYPGQQIVGTITGLPTRQRDTFDGQVASQGYTINFSAGDLDLDVGDRVQVRVDLGRAEGVLWLPPAAIDRSEAQAFVILRDRAGERRVDVVLGLESPERIEILSGLAQGDLVVAPNASVTP
ncbi:biotin/lipoyl-binding protein [Candidatus Viridilinea mediisalina]|nr:biotin/lipoyl-binding protein [Candidatus Viridilinea mediisalina]